MEHTQAEGLYLRQLAVGPMKNWVYLLGAPESQAVAVVDPAWDVQAIVSAIAEDDKTLGAILLTHHHADHINGVPELLKTHDVPVYVQAAEFDFAQSVRAFPGAVRRVSPGQCLSVGPLELTCIHTPGHTPGSQCFFCRDSLISGDTLFVNACGRCDLPGGNAGLLFDSLQRLCAELPAQTVLCPGHDYGDLKVSSLERERAMNPYLQLSERDAFVKLRNRPR